MISSNPASLTPPGTDRESSLGSLDTGDIEHSVHPTTVDPPRPVVSEAQLAIVDDDPVILRVSEMPFTIPLPGEPPSSPAAKERLAASDTWLQQGRLRAARDACYALLGHDPDHAAVFLRIAEINAVLGAVSDARRQATALVRQLEIGAGQTWLWRVYRLLAYLEQDPLPSLLKVIDLRIEIEEIGEASPYAAYLIRLLSERGEFDEAMKYSTRVCELEPGKTGAALEHTVLLVKAGKPNDAIDRWERAADAGADIIIGRAALAPIMSTVDAAEHWAMVAEVAAAVREDGLPEPVNAYRRIAGATDSSPTLTAGVGLLLSLVNPAAAGTVLEQTDFADTPVAGAIGHVVLSSVLTGPLKLDARADALRTAISSLQSLEENPDLPWNRLLGWTPTVANLSSRLAETLIDAGETKAAITVIERLFERAPADEELGIQLADMYTNSGKLGAALSVLDRLAAALGNTGRLPAMARVLRRMSDVAPDNIKVKSRLIDAFLKRGFVAEARAELLHRADLEQQADKTDAALESLQRAASLGWTIGLHEEAFAIFHRVLVLDPRSLPPRHALVTLYLQAGRVEEATAQQREIVDLALEAKQPQEAIAALHQIIGITPGDTAAYHRLAETLADLGEYKQAERVYRRLAVVDPEESAATTKAEAVAARVE